jgi:SAM-dependent methyltransferase
MHGRAMGIVSALTDGVPSPTYQFTHCIVCGHADADELANADDIRAEVEALWAYHQRRLRLDTPPARLLDRVAFSQHPPVRLVRCRECGLIYRNPAEREDELREIYGRETPAPDVLRSLHDTQRAAVRGQARALRRALGRGGSGLEVGSYVGAFLAAARLEGLQIEGIDINPEVNAFTRSMGFVVHDGELSSFQTNRAFDAVAIWNTFDQLADPLGAVHAAQRLLRPNGIFAVRVPNGAFYAARRAAVAHGNPMRRRAARALLAQNNLLSFPYRWGFTPRSLVRLLGAHGFTVRHMRGDVLVPLADAWTRPWAGLEESLIKGALGGLAHMRLRWAPWFEVYASRD